MVRAGAYMRSNSVPKAMMPVYERIIGLTDDVCDRQLNSEYRDLARDMTGALCRKRPSPLSSGQHRTWAGGIVYVLGRINFLGDRSFPPYMTTADLCAAFGVGESTVHAKARVIEKALRIGVFDPKWALPSLVGSNPLVWMAEVDGLLVDLRTMSRESRKWLSPRASFRTSPQMRRTDRDPWSRGAQHGGKSLSQAPEKESPEGIARMADCDDCLLWPEPEPSHKGCRGHRAI